jgi:RNA polymerase sigma-70 factor (ECF subfamily)
VSAFIKVISAAKPPYATVEGRPLLDVAEVHAAHADFVWRSLSRLGVRDADLPDMLQEVFLVVHKRAAAFDGSAKLTSWLFGICLRVAARYRRRPHIRREQPLEARLEKASESDDSPERALEAARARVLLAHVLDAMPLGKRAIFVMFEIDAMSCTEIASALGLPLGTVHSRLHSARRAFAAALTRVRAQSGRRL